MNSPQLVAETQNQSELSLDDRLYVEQIRLLYSRGPGVLAGVYTTAVIWIVSLWWFVDHSILLAWLAVFTLLIIARAIMLKRFPNTHLGPKQAQRWHAYFVFTVGLSGCLWGAGNLIFFDPNEPFLIALLVIFTLGVAAGAANSTSTSMWAFFAYLIPAVMPLAVRILIEGEGVYIPLGLGVAFYAVGSTSFAKAFHKITMESLHLRFENLDLIDKLTIEKERAEAEKQAAEEANIAKSRFLAATSHDLRQPLHALGLFVDSLGKKLQTDEQLLLLNKIEGSVNALDQLFNALLDISKLDAGIVEVQRDSFYLRDILARLQIELMPMAAEKKLTLRFLKTKAIILSDPVLIERILRNLIVNAILYTEQGRILVGCRHQGADLRLEVWDTGAGIPESELSHIFSEFHQLHNPERDRSKGLGLGLAIVKRLCDLLGHRIEVHSRLAQGSVFRLSVPRGESQNVNSLTNPLSRASSNLEGLQVMIIDDEIAILEAMTSVLSDWGCRVVCADTIANAVQALSQLETPPDIVITDYRLRDNTTGINAVHAINQTLGRKIPAIVVTGDTSEQILQMVVSGGWVLLHKPLKPVQLRLAIHQTLSQNS